MNVYIILHFASQSKKPNIFTIWIFTEKSMPVFILEGYLFLLIQKIMCIRTKIECLLCARPDTKHFPWILPLSFITVFYNR